MTHTANVVSTGLISFNVVSFLFALAAVLSWLVQYLVKLRSNVLMREDVLNGGWTSEGKAVLDYSFWMVMFAAFIFFVHSAIFLRYQRHKSRSLSAKAQIIDATKPNGNLMLY